MGVGVHQGCMKHNVNSNETNHGIMKHAYTYCHMAIMILTCA